MSSIVSLKDRIRCFIHDAFSPTKNTIGAARTRLTIWEMRSFKDYQRHRKAFAHRIHKRIQGEHRLAEKGMRFSTRGFCVVCMSEVKLQTDERYCDTSGERPLPNYREHLICPSCRLNNRMRASIHFLKDFCPSDQQVYITEQVTPLFRHINRLYPHTIGSEYLGTTIPFGTQNEAGIRNESITALTFEDCSFDTLLSFDVLEHVPDYRQAFAECFRVLKNGGQMIFSVPFKHQQETTIRAIVNADGSITHLLPPEYHGDPVQDSGCLCFQYFGWDMLEDLRSAGFSDARMVLYYSNRFGYLGGGEQGIFMATK